MTECLSEKEFGLPALENKFSIGGPDRSTLSCIF